MNAAPKVGGALLTGGASRRMGFDKALVEVDGLPNALRLARALAGVASPLVEVGPGYSGLEAVREAPAGAGPLAALCAGAAALQQVGHAGPVLVVSCDLPFMTAQGLGTIAAWPGEASVVPVAQGRLQPLCARWSPADLAVASRLTGAGERSMKSLLDSANFIAWHQADWPAPLTEEAFADFDTPTDLRNLGLCAPGPAGGAGTRCWSLTARAHHA